MAEKQPPTIVEGATTGDVEDEIPVAAKSAEDRKAAAALSSLDTRDDESSSAAKDVDREAVKKAMDRLAATGGYDGGNVSKKDEGKKEPPKPAVKVDQADVAYLVEELELPKPKAIELLKAHQGSWSSAVKAYISPPEEGTLAVA